MSKVSTRPQQAATPPAEAESIHNPRGGRPARQDPQSPPASSPTLITLQVRSRQQFFLRSPSEVIDEAGFGRSKQFVCTALVTRDTGDTIADVKWDGWLAAMHELSQVDVRCDPARCALEDGAGRRLLAAVRALAANLDGYIADGTGRELSEEELTALGQYIDVVLDQRAADAAPKGVRIDADTLRFQGTLSFQYFDHVKRKGARLPVVRHGYFPTESTEFFEGRFEGTRRAAELVNFVREHRERSSPLMETLSEIFKSGQWENRYNPAGHIAGGFLEVIEEVFRAGCTAISLGWLIGRMQSAERRAEIQREAVAEEKAEFSKRMKAAKAAKRASATGGAA